MRATLQSRPVSVTRVSLSLLYNLVGLRLVRGPFMAIKSTGGTTQPTPPRGSDPLFLFPPCRPQRPVPAPSPPPIQSVPPRPQLGLRSVLPPPKTPHPTIQSIILHCIPARSHHPYSSTRITISSITTNTCRWLRPLCRWLLRSHLLPHATTPTQCFRRPHRRPQNELCAWRRRHRAWVV